MAQNNAAEDIRQVLLDEGITTPIFIEQESDTLATCITLYNTLGQASNAKFLIDYPQMHVRVKDIRNSDAFNKAQELFDLLVGKTNFTVGTTKYVVIQAITSIFSLGKTEDLRHFLAGFNLRLVVVPEYVSQHRKAI